MLELLWIHNPEEVRSEPIQPIHLWERWVDRSRGACPFGFCLRSTAHPMSVLPFSTWEYRPPYLPESLNIPVATNAAVLTEPMLFCLAFGQQPDTYPTDKYQPLEHAAGLREVTRVELVSPYAHSLSPELKAIVNSHLIRLRLVQLATVDYQGEIVNSAEAEYAPEDTSFTLSLKGGAAKYLLLTITSQDSQQKHVYDHSLKIDRLTVSQYCQIK